MVESSNRVEWNNKSYQVGTIYELKDGTKVYLLGVENNGLEVIQVCANGILRVDELFITTAIPSGNTKEI